jgi:hypothetical protein
MTTLIHVNQGNVRSNKHREEGNKLPVLRAQGDFETIYGDSIHIIDDDGEIVASVVYSPDKPLPCGAKVWIETELDILCS